MLTLPKKLIGHICNGKFDVKKLIARLRRRSSNTSNTNNPTVIGTVEVRQGGRQVTNLHVLVAGMVLIVIAFAAIWFLGLTLT